MSQKTPGIVHLIGAGPGDPLLLTLRGKQLLEQADVVVYDHLANPRLLQFSPNAKLIYVGKKAADHFKTQEQINQILIDEARAGNRVARLKGGDPFVFGRGGEECEALHAAGIIFEVVPGITAAIAVAAYAGIPITHRDLNSSFTLITGHEKEEDRKDPLGRGRKSAVASDLDYSAIAKLPCIAFYMGVKTLPRLCANLIVHGKSKNTPAATIQWGTTSKQRTIVGTLENLAERVAAAKIGAPAITIVGRVVELRETLNWFENRSLFGKTIAVTRTRQQASELSLKLESLGAHVIEAPTIELSPPSDWQHVDAALNAAANFDWIIFTSANGVRAARDRLRELNLDVRIFGNAKLAAIGESTAAAIQNDLALRVDLCPQSFVAEALAKELIDSQQVTGKRFLLLRADIARPILAEKLREANAAEVRDVAIYETHSSKALPSELLDAIDAGNLDWITFTSSSTADNFVRLLGPERFAKLAKIKIASIGPITSKKLRELNLEPTVQAERFDVDGLVDAISSPPLPRTRGRGPG